MSHDETHRVWQELWRHHICWFMLAARVFSSQKMKRWANSKYLGHAFWTSGCYAPCCWCSDPYTVHNNTTGVSIHHNARNDKHSLVSETTWLYRQMRSTSFFWGTLLKEIDALGCTTHWLAQSCSCSDQNVLALVSYIIDTYSRAVYCSVRCTVGRSTGYHR